MVDDGPVRLCNRCGKTKPLTEFYSKGRSGRHQSQCKACKRPYCRVHSLKYYHNNKDAVRTRRRLGITVDGSPRKPSAYNKSERKRELDRLNARSYRKRKPMVIRAYKARRRAILQRDTSALASNEGAPWTSTEDVIVLRSDRTIAQIAFILRRSYKAVLTRRSKLRAGTATGDSADAKRAAGFRRHWTGWIPEEDALLFQGFSVPELANMLGRTECAVQKRRERLISEEPKCCARCGRSLAGTGRPKYCSDECAKPASVTPERTCAVCERSFIGWGPQKYCSDDCVAEVKRAYDAQYTARRPKAEWDRSPRVCSHHRCGQEFVPQHVGQGYCGRKCQKRASRHRERLAGTRR